MCRDNDHETRHLRRGRRRWGRRRERCCCDRHHRDGCRCCCGEGCDCQPRSGGLQRRYTSRAERIASLEGYLADLEAETTAVRERIADLEAGVSQPEPQGCSGA